MAKPPTSYGAPLKLRTPEPETKPPSEEAQKPDSGTRRRPMESKSDPTVLYLHPDGKYELKLELFRVSGGVATAIGCTYRI